jgi:hypothetical protein
VVVSEDGGEFYLGNGVSSSMRFAICIPPICSGAGEATRCIKYFLPVSALGYVEPLFLDFSQSSACSGSWELQRVGGLWLMNSRCLSLGGGGGGCCWIWRS